MKKYVVEYMNNGSQYTVETFTDFTMAIAFYNRISKREWARIS